MEYRSTPVLRENDILSAKRKTKIAQTISKFDEERFEEYYRTRLETPDIRMKEDGKFPYSFYLVNRVKFMDSSSKTTDHNESARTKTRSNDTFNLRKNNSMPKLGSDHKRLKLAEKQIPLNLLRQQSNKTLAVTERDHDFIKKIYKRNTSVAQSVKNLYEMHEPVIRDGDSNEINAIIKKSLRMRRYDFLKKRKERQEEARKSLLPSASKTKLCFDIKDKNYITRESMQNDFQAKQHINQPMIECKATIARSISTQVTNYVNQRRISFKHTNTNSTEGNSAGIQEQSFGYSEAKNRDLGEEKKQLKAQKSTVEPRQQNDIKIVDDHNAKQDSLANHQQLLHGPGYPMANNVKFQQQMIQRSSLIKKELEEINEVSFDLAHQRQSGQIMDLSVTSQNENTIMQNTFQKSEMIPGNSSVEETEESGNPEELQKMWNTGDFANFDEIDIKQQQTMWRFRLTDSDFFERYLEDQKRMKEEISRQEALMNIVKPKPYVPQLIVKSQEELKQTYKTNQKTKAHNDILKQNSAKFQQLQSLKKMGSKLKNVRSSGALLQKNSNYIPRASLDQQQFLPGYLTNSQSRETTMSPNDNNKDPNFRQRRNESDLAAKRMFGTSLFGTFDNEMTDTNAVSRMDTGGPRQLATSKSVIPEADVQNALLETRNTPIRQNRPITREPAPFNQKSTYLNTKRQTSQDDSISILNIRLPESELASQSMMQTQQSLRQHKKIFKQVKKQVASIAEDYVKKQRQLIEERTYKGSRLAYRDSSMCSESALDTTRQGAFSRSPQQWHTQNHKHKKYNQTLEAKDQDDDSSLKTSESLKNGSQQNISRDVKMRASPNASRLGSLKSSPRIWPRRKLSTRSVHKSANKIKRDFVPPYGNGYSVSGLSKSSLEKSQSSDHSPIIQFTAANDEHDSNPKQLKIFDGQSVLPESLREIQEQRPTLKSKANWNQNNPSSKELKQRHKFKVVNKKLNKKIQINAQIMVPDPNLEILDMMPRTDIIEDQVYRRAIPKSIKMYKLRRNFSEALDHLPDLTKFSNGVTRAALQATKEREERYHREELREANQTMRDSMRETLDITKNIKFTKAKADIEAKALRTVKAQTSKLFQKPLISDMIKSRSTLVTKSSINKQTKQRLFGGIPTTYPEDSPLIHMLELLNEEQLLRLNQKICKLYEKNLQANSQQHKIIVDTDARIRKRRPHVSPHDNRKPFEGPPLQRKPGRFKFQDKAENPITKFEMSPSMQLRRGTVVPYRKHHQARPESLISIDGPGSLFNQAMKVDKNELQEFSNQSPDAKKETDPIDKIGYRSSGTMYVSNKKKVNKNLAMIRQLNEKFQPLEEYQELVSKAIQDAIGHEMFLYRSFYATKDVSAEMQRQKSASASMYDAGDRGTQSAQTLNEEGFAQTGTLINQDAPVQKPIKRLSKMIRRSEAIEKLSRVASDEQMLPSQLKNNTLRADRLLIKEAQVNYLQRRKAMQRQIIVDNVNFVTVKQITDRVDEPVEAKQRKERNRLVKEKAQKVIVREEKAKYKGEYKTIVKQREAKLQQDREAAENKVKEIMMSISVNPAEKKIIKSLKKLQSRVGTQFYSEQSQI